MSNVPLALTQELPFLLYSLVVNRARAGESTLWLVSSLESLVHRVQASI